VWTSPRTSFSFKTQHRASMRDVPKSSVVLDRELEEGKSRGPSEPRIRCPLCGWSPREDDRWSCNCGHEWNTFDTGGVCPGCLYRWAETQCLGCGRWSAHSDWYTQGRK
jgi:hypothetical protein